MESTLKELKKNLRNALVRFISDTPAMGEFRENCLNFIESIYILKKLINDRNHRNNLIEQYNLLLNSLNGYPDQDSLSYIENTLKMISKMYINYIGVLLMYDPLQIKSVIKRSSDIFKRFTSILSNCIGSIFESHIIEKVQFGVSWETYIKQALLNLGIITHDSIVYARNLAYSILVKEPNNELLGVVDPSKIQTFARYLFGDLSNLKFFFKASKIYSEFKIQLAEVNRENPLESIKFTCTSAQNIEIDEKNPSQISLGKSFNLLPNGSSTSLRYDYISFFGKHPHCDFIFPNNAQGIEDISFAIYHNGNAYYIIDCNKNSHLKFKLEPNHFYNLQVGLLLDVSERAIMKISNIYLREDQISQESISLLDYEFLTGELSHALVSRTKTLITSQNKTEFILGRGGLGVDATILFVEEAKVSRKHLQISCNNSRWVVYDFDSKYGTFMLFKNFTEYSTKKSSNCLKLFNKIEEGINFLTLRIEGYSFFFEKT